MAKLILPAMRKQVYLSVCVSLGSVVIISLAALIFSRLFACSMLIGGSIWFLPQGYAALSLFHQIETNPRRFLAVFYKSEIVKLVIVGVLSVLVAKWTAASFMGILAGYLCAQVIFWLYYLIVLR